MSLDTSSTIVRSRLAESGAWKLFRAGWWLLNGVFVVYLVASYTGVFRASFPQLFTVLDSEVFFRTVAFGSVLLTGLCWIFKRQIIGLLAVVEANYEAIVSGADAAAYRYYDGRTGLDMLLRLTALVVGGVLAWYALSDIAYYLLLIREDNVVETASTLLWFAATFVILLSLFAGLRQGASKTFYLLLALFFFVCGGEEISWGQRLFEIDTPELLRGINVQEEITLHNIGSISLFSNAFFLISLVFFLLVPWLQRRLQGFTVYLAHFGLPGVRRGATVVYLIGLAVWLIVGFRYGTLGFHPFTLWDYYEQLDDELFEMMVAFAYFAFAALDLEGRLQA